MEGIAKVAETQPELAAAELKIARHVVGELTDGKLFVDELKDAIQQVIDKVMAPKEPEFNKEQADSQLERERFVFEQQRAVFQDQMAQQKLTSETTLEQLKIQAEQQIRIAELQQKERFESLSNQLEQIKLGNEVGIKTQELNQNAAQLQADIALAQQEIANKRNEFLLQAREIADKSEIKQIEMILDSRVAEQKAQLEQLYLQLEKEKTVLVEKEKWATEQRLQAEHQMEVLMNVTEMQRSLKEIKEAPPAPITVNVELPKSTKKRRKAKILRDASGAASELEFEELEE